MCVCVCVCVCIFFFFIYKLLFMIGGMLSAYSKRNLLICNVHNFHGLILFKGRLIVVVLLL